MINFYPFHPTWIALRMTVSSQPLKAHLNQEITLALSFTEPHHKHGQRWRLYYENISLLKLLFLCSKVYLHTLTIYMGCLEIADMGQLEEQWLVWWPKGETKGNSKKLFSYSFQNQWLLPLLQWNNILVTHIKPSVCSTEKLYMPALPLHMHKAKLSLELCAAE